MIRPLNFGFNTETAPSNAFQHRDPGRQDRAEIQAGARAEFDAMVGRLRARGIEVVCLEDTPEPVKPDAVFPNNWLSMHANGDVVLYPMAVPNRRAEVRPDVVAALTREHGFVCNRLHDLRDSAALGGVLEGTGSLVLDSDARLAFACLSPRTEAPAVREFCRRFDYRPILFHARGRSGASVYHTNVLMALGSGFAVICAEAISDSAERQAVLRHIEASGREVVEISMDEMSNFAGNLLELDGGAAKPLLVGSEAAFASLRHATRDRLERRCEPIAVSVPTIERYGGGSARCMLAQIELPRA
jgi:hypothetical protein